MKTDAPIGLQNLLYQNDQHFVAVLLTLYFADGTRYWTTWGNPLTIGTTTWDLGPGVDMGEFRFTEGTETDTLRFVLYPNGVQIGNTPMFQAALGGLFDGVRVVVQLAFMLTPTDASQGAIVVFDGAISQVEPGTTEIRVTARSLLEKLTRRIPSRVNLPQCPYQLFSALCGVTEASHSRLAAAGSTAAIVNLDSASSYAALNSRMLISGVQRTIQSVSGTAVTLSVPFPFVPAVGASVTIYPGCDKQRKTCRDVFNNLVHFGGFPDTPKAEVA